MAVSSGNGEVTISTTISGGTVTSVGVTSNALVITGGAITTTGVIGIDLPSTLNISGSVTGGNLNTSGKVVYSGSQALANLGAVSLTTTASYFTTTAASTATMAAGTEGQIKTLVMNSASGSMVITVTSPGWTGAGTMTFSATGQGCTLMCVNSKWFCVGNNGVAFA